MRKISFFGILWCALACLDAKAADPFTLTASGGSTDVSANGTNLVDLTSNLINSENQFTALAGQSLNGSLRYGSLSNAVLFTRNASGTSATLTIPSTGFSQTFTAANEDALNDQIEDFFKKNGADEYANFLRSVNEQTTLGVTDGNPLATTALAADASFYRFGFQSPRFDLGEGPRLPAGFQADAAAGASSSDYADGWYGTVGFGNTFRLGDRVGLSINLDARYRDVEGASVYEVVNTDGIPILLIAPERDGGLSWMVTPAFVVGFGGSWDLAAGGFPIGGQITSSLAYRAGGWTFVLANQYGYYDGLGIEVSDFDFDTDVSQSILKNGVQIIRTFGRGFVDAGVAYTNFLNDAAVDSYWTPRAGVGMRFGTASGVRIGYHGDFGDGFTNNGADVQLFLTF